MQYHMLARLLFYWNISSSAWDKKENKIYLQHYNYFSHVGHDFVMFLYDMTLSSCHCQTMSFDCDSDCFKFHQLPSGWPQHHMLPLATSHQHNTGDPWMSPLGYRLNVGSTVDTFSSMWRCPSGVTLGQNFFKIASRHLSIRSSLLTFKSLCRERMKFSINSIAFLQSDLKVNNFL